MTSIKQRGVRGSVKGAEYLEQKWKNIFEGRAGEDKQFVTQEQISREGVRFVSHDKKA